MTSNFPTSCAMTRESAHSCVHNFREERNASAVVGTLPVGAALVVLEAVLDPPSTVPSSRKLSFRRAWSNDDLSGHLRLWIRLGMVGEGKSRGGLLAKQDEYRKGSVGRKWMKKRICHPLVSRTCLRRFSLKMSVNPRLSFLCKRYSKHTIKDNRCLLCENQTFMIFFPKILILWKVCTSESTVVVM